MAWPGGRARAPQGRMEMQPVPARERGRWSGQSSARPARLPWGVGRGAPARPET